MSLLDSFFRYVGGRKNGSWSQSVGARKAGMTDAVIDAVLQIRGMDRCNSSGLVSRSLSCA